MAKAMSKESITTPSAERLAEAARKEMSNGLPPVHLWDPPFCGDLDMRIARDGTWYYLGSPITRPALVRLFSTIIRREDGKFFLVTPVEKVGITVDDAPFVAVDFDVAGQGDNQVLVFETNVGDKVLASLDTPLRVEIDAETGEPAPYVVVRSDLEALIDRKSFYRLIDIATHNSGNFGVWSDGTFFPIAPSEDALNA